MQFHIQPLGGARLTGGIEKFEHTGEEETFLLDADGSSLCVSSFLYHSKTCWEIKTSTWLPAQQRILGNTATMLYLIDTEHFYETFYL